MDAFVTRTKREPVQGMVSGKRKYSRAASTGTLKVRGSNVTIAKFTRQQHMMYQGQIWHVDPEMPKFILNDQFDMEGWLKYDKFRVTSVFPSSPSDDVDDCMSICDDDDSDSPDDSGKFGQRHSDILLHLVASFTMQRYFRQVEYVPNVADYLEHLYENIVVYTMKAFPKTKICLKKEDLRYIGIDFDKLPKHQREAVDIMSEHMTGMQRKTKPVSKLFMPASMASMSLGLQYLLKHDVVVVEAMRDMLRMKRFEIRDLQERLWKSLDTFDMMDVSSSCTRDVSEYESGGHKLSVDQQCFFQKLYQCGITLLSGVPGGGKTFCLSRLLAHEPCVVLTFMHKARIVLSAALVNLGASTECVSTCHTFLYFAQRLESEHGAFRKPKGKTTIDWKTAFFEYLQNNAEEITTLVFEEASMVQLDLFVRSMEASIALFPNLKRIVLVGDPAQLLPIDGDGGLVFHTLLHKNLVNEEDNEARPRIAHVALTRSHRTDVSVVAKNNVSMRECVLGRQKTFTFDVEPLVCEEFLVTERVKEGKYDVSPQLVDLFCAIFKTCDTWLICSVNVEVNYYNTHIQRKLLGVQNMFKENTVVIAKGNRSDLGVYNGDRYRIKSIQQCGHSNDFEFRLSNMLEGSSVLEPFTCQKKDFEEVFSLGYAMTSYKSQGGEVDVAIASIVASQWSGLRGLFTSVSRAKNRVIVATRDPMWRKDQQLLRRDVLDLDLLNMSHVYSTRADVNQGMVALSDIIDSSLKECCICFDEKHFMEMKVLQCSHVVCETCHVKIKETSAKCPMCRVQLVEYD
jgi:hypothetical protein